MTEAKKERVRVSSGGSWQGDMWVPQGPTEAQIEAAAKYENQLLDESSASGKLYRGKAFDQKDVFFLKMDGEKDLLMPEHTALSRDLTSIWEEHGEGAEVEIEYKGKVRVQNGKWKGKEAHAYDVYRLA